MRDDSLVNQVGAKFCGATFEQAQDVVRAPARVMYELAAEGRQARQLKCCAFSLGNEQIAYVREIDLPDGAHAIGIFSADGKPMAAAASVELAQALIRQHDLEPALVH